jgi:hypothetical protein
MDALLFSGLASTAYGQLYMSSSVDEIAPDPAEAFQGQRNGLCGAAIAGSLFLVTGTHTGDIPVQVLLTADAPPIGDWEEVVETSFTPAASDIRFEGWGGMFVCRLHLPLSSYRVRWCANGMDAGHGQDVAMPGQPAPDRYQLTFWPGPVAADEILRVTGEYAAYWHSNGFPR